MDWLADGGILDNSPFAPVLDEIARQPVSAPWQRTLCYIAPAAEEARLGREINKARVTTPDTAETSGTTTGDCRRGAAGDPPPWTTVAWAAFGLPREIDFRDDIEQLHEAIRGGRSSYDVTRFRLLTDPPDDQPRIDPQTQAGGQPEALLAQACEIASAALPLYRQNCAAAGVYQVRDAISAGDESGYLEPAREVNPAPVLAENHEWLPVDFPPSLPGSWSWGIGAAERVVRLMLGALREADGVEDAARRDLSYRVRCLTSISEAVMDALAREGSASPSLSEADAAARLDRVYTELNVPSAAAFVVVKAATRYAGTLLPATGQDSDALRQKATDVLRAALCVEVSDNAGSLPASPSRPMFSFARVGISDPPQLFAAAFEAAKEKACLATRTPGCSYPPMDILYGTRLGHFAAFGCLEWREWDWMWGRLHAVVQLGRILGLTGSDVDALAGAVVIAEGRSVNDVNKEIGTVLALTTPEMKTQLRSAGIVRQTLDAVFELLRSEATTNPPLPKWLARIGKSASVLLAPNPGRLNLKERLLRHTYMGTRKAFGRVRDLLRRIKGSPSGGVGPLY